jgi:hypothetical protein
MDYTESKQNMVGTWAFLTPRETGKQRAFSTDSSVSHSHPRHAAGDGEGLAATVDLRRRGREIRQRHDGIITSALGTEGLVTPVVIALIPPTTVKTRSRHGIPMITTM